MRNSISIYLCMTWNSREEEVIERAFDNEDDANAFVAKKDQEFKDKVMADGDISEEEYNEYFCGSTYHIEVRTVY